MNVYDFDKTIFSKDSSIEFYKFCLKKYKRVKRVIFKQLKAIFLYAFKKIDKTSMKERLFVFLKYVPDVDVALMEFWLTNKTGFNSWYFDKHKDDDIVISASPTFLIAPAMQLLNIETFIASKVDKRTGKFSGFNCHGEEKVRRLKKDLGITEIDKFYSDSYSDTPLALLAKKAYIVKGEQLSPWKFNKKQVKNV